MNIFTIYQSLVSGAETAANKEECLQLNLSRDQGVVTAMAGT